jgi:hypothetical protein
MLPASACFLFGPLINIEDGGYVPPKHCASTKLHGITIQTTAVFIVTAIGTSNQTIQEQFRQQSRLLLVFFSHCVANSQLHNEIYEETKRNTTQSVYRVYNERKFRRNTFPPSSGFNTNSHDTRVSSTGYPEI